MAIVQSNCSSLAGQLRTRVWECFWHFLQLIPRCHLFEEISVLRFWLECDADCKSPRTCHCTQVLRRPVLLEVAESGRDNHKMSFLLSSSPRFLMEFHIRTRSNGPHTRLKIYGQSTCHEVGSIYLNITPCPGTRLSRTCVNLLQIYVYMYSCTIGKLSSFLLFLIQFYLY